LSPTAPDIERGTLLDTSDASWQDLGAVTELVEWLVDGVEHVVDVGLHDTFLLVHDTSHIVLDDVGVRGAELQKRLSTRETIFKRIQDDAHEVKVVAAHGIGIDDVVAVGIVSSGADGVCAADVGGGFAHDGKASGFSTTEPVGGEGLVAEDGAHGVSGKLGGGAIGEELENESNFGEDGENARHVELELLVILLILLESVVLELLEDLVVDDGVLAIRSIIAVAANVEEEGVEEILLEVDAVADGNISASRGDITCA
jgi:hypothetical protein